MVGCHSTRSMSIGPLKRCSPCGLDRYPPDAENTKNAINHIDQCLRFLNKESEQPAA